MITNVNSGTTIHEVESGIFRINTPVPPEVMPGGFSFNQYLVVDDEPLIFHTGPRAMFPLVREAIEHVLPVSRLRWIAFSHFEADECGSLNDFLAVAPEASPLCSRVAALVSVNDTASRPARALADGETFSIGMRTLEWIDAPHVPHNWETGYLLDRTTRTLFCGDLFTQGGHQTPALTESDILESTEAFRLAGIEGGMYDYWSCGADTQRTFERIAATRPQTLACMHGSAWRGSDAAPLILELASRVSAAPAAAGRR
jgi:flavorubredoxin